jgi:hypothetical protein
MLAAVTASIMAWFLQPGIQTNIFTTRLLALLSQLMTSYLATYPQ